ncbi:zinc finger BED domain-containing protein 4-like [Diabrotica undecimpunctata]|uniref:zinc finger BED domain-containing protein 4-like n=1 Tax=Diabrotica undecimpunctata TaxID=50387 RepID=UPI003B641969
MAERCGIEVPSSTEWELVNNLISVLTCFYQATLDLSADSAYVSLVIPLIKMLNGKVPAKEQDSEEISLLKLRLRESLIKRFANITNLSELSIATLLDPRYKSKYLTDEEVITCKVSILKFLRESDSSKFSYTNKVAMAIASTSSSTTTHVVDLENNSLWNAHDTFVTAVLDTTKEIHNDNDPNADYLDSYLREDLLLRSADIFHSWESSPCISLKTAAKKFLSAPLTSVSSEQLFSSARQLYADRRTNLLGENADKILFLTYNIRMFDFEY